MGAAVVERIVAKRPVRGAALLAPLPPAGLLPVATRLAASHPDVDVVRVPGASHSIHDERAHRDEYARRVDAFL
jgi:pimeloyl-ACP methyl ester carboxylesterase